MTCDEFKKETARDIEACSRAERAAWYRHLMDCLDCRGWFEAGLVRSCGMTLAETELLPPDAEMEALAQEDMEDQEFREVTGFREVSDGD